MIPHPSAVNPASVRRDRPWMVAAAGLCALQATLVFVLAGASRAHLLPEGDVAAVTEPLYIHLRSLLAVEATAVVAVLGAVVWTVLAGAGPHRHSRRVAVGLVVVTTLFHLALLTVSLLPVLRVVSLATVAVGVVAVMMTVRPTDDVDPDRDVDRR